MEEELKNLKANPVQNGHKTTTEPVVNGKIDSKHTDEQMVAHLTQVSQIEKGYSVLNQQLNRCLTELAEWKTKCMELEKKVLMLEAENANVNRQIKTKDILLDEQDMRMQVLQ